MSTPHENADELQQRSNLLNDVAISVLSAQDVYLQAQAHIHDIQATKLPRFEDIRQLEFRVDFGDGSTFTGFKGSDPKVNVTYVYHEQKDLMLRVSLWGISEFVEYIFVGEIEYAVSFGSSEGVMTVKRVAP